MAKQTEKRTLKDMLALERSRMLPLNFTFTYILTPAYVAAAAVLALLFGGFSTSGNLPAGAVCFGILLLLTVAFLAARPYVRRRAIRSELQRYHAERLEQERDRLESRTEWDFSENELSVRFNRYGMTVDGTLSYYNHMDKLLYTANEHHRVGIYVCFSEPSGQYILLPLSARVLKMLGDFEIRLANQDALDEILAHPQEAFAEIYDKGKVSV